MVFQFLKHFFIMMMQFSAIDLKLHYIMDLYTLSDTINMFLKKTEDRVYRTIKMSIMELFRFLFYTEIIWIKKISRLKA